MLLNVKSLAETPPSLEAANVFDVYVYMLATLYVPEGCGAAYKAAKFWKNFKSLDDTPVEDVRIDGDGWTGDEGWYDMQGVRHEQKPDAHGVYTHHGKKVRL